MCYLTGNIRKSLWIVLFLDKTWGDLRAALHDPQPGKLPHPLSELWTEYLERKKHGIKILAPANTTHPQWICIFKEIALLSGEKEQEIWEKCQFQIYEFVILDKLFNLSVSQFPHL